MEQEFVIPARPWGEAEVKYLAENVHLLDEETRDELGPLYVEPVNDFQAEDAPEKTIVVTQEILDENPVLADAGVQVGDVGVATNNVPEGAMVEGGLPTDTDGAVVDNQTPDNA